MSPYVAILRPAGIFTALADVFAGYLLCTEGFQPETLPFLVAALLASACLYGSGMVLNDTFDAELDRVARPHRPIPSGKIALGTALTYGIFLMALGLVAAGAGGLQSFWVAACLAFLILSYDRLTKAVRLLGSFNMGLCRMTNALLGAAAAGNLALVELPPGTPLWHLAGLLIYITSVTLVSELEDAPGRRWQLLLFSLLIVTALALPPIAAVRLHLGALGVAAAAAGTLALAATHVKPAALSIRSLQRAALEKWVQAGVLGVILLDAAFVAAGRGPLWGLAVAGLLVPASILIPRVKVT